MPPGRRARTIATAPPPPPSLQLLQLRFSPPVERSQLTDIDLAHFGDAPCADSASSRLACRGAPPCPRFGRCSDDPAVQSCWNSHLVDAEIGGIDHPAHGSLRVARFAGTVVMVRSVYVNGVGAIFNDTHVFNKGGCACAMPFSHAATGNGTRVTRFRDVLSLAHWNGGDFYHALADVLMAALALEPLRALLPGIPTAFRIGQGARLHRSLLPLVGVAPESMNSYEIGRDEVFYADTVIVPVYPPCAQPSRAQLSYFRRTYVLPLLPAATALTGCAGCSRRNQGSCALSQASLWAWLDAAPSTCPVDHCSGWRVILGVRHKTRQLVQHDEILAGLVDSFGLHRVVLFDGAMEILEARELFGTACLFVAVHGGHMTNMVFLPEGASVLEIQPREYVNNCFSYLASACGLAYYHIWGSGSKNTPTSIKASEVLAVVNTMTLPGV
eukprot:SM000024S07784  [mRNA]  locus=s24:395214:396685:- [translate_table: standard]